jgi:EmrB/QacA subfamily drug resistance transporter
MKPTSAPVAHALLLLLLVLSGLDQTLLSSALPTIVRELGGADRSSWVFSAFLFASTVVIPVYGKLADRWGVRPLLLTAAGLFIAGSLACGVAPTMDTLIAARALQGLGGGGLMTLTVLAVSALAAPEERSARMARLGAAYGLATMAGPLAGAFVTEHLSWRWTFFAAAPLALVAWAGLARTPMAGPQGERRPLDWPGALLLATLLVCAILATRSRAFGAATTTALAVAAAALLPLWLWRQFRAADPIVPLSLFALPGFAANVWLAASTGMSLFAAVVFLPVFLQSVQHLSPTVSSLHLLPLMAGLILASRRAGVQLRRGTPPRILGAAASIAMAGSLAAIAGLLHAGIASAWTLSAVVLPMGAGLGLVMPVLSVVSQRAAPPEQVGIATALPMMLRALGGAMGVALLGEYLARHAAGGLVSALAGVFTAAALAALPACFAARWLPVRFGPIASLTPLADDSLVATRRPEKTA